MIDVAGVVRNTSYEISGQALPLSFITVFSAFNRVHGIWRWYRHATIYSNPDNFLALAAGHTVNYLTGDRLIIRISAISVLIAHRILMVVDQINKVQESYRRLKNAYLSEYEKPIKYVYGNEWKYQIKRVLEKMKRIFLRFTECCKESFVLSMRMIDATQMFYMTHKTCDEGINEMFVNGAELLDKLEQNQEALSASLKECQPVIEKILKGIGSQFTAEQFIDASSKAIKKVTDTHKTFKGANTLIGSFFIELGKSTLTFLAHLGGVKHLVPEELRPTPFKPFKIPRRVKLAPKNLITIKN